MHTPESLSTESQPSLRIPLRHFVVGLGFLIVGVAWTAAGVVVGPRAFGAVVAAHLLLVGWVVITILGAMSQFVPVWSGRRLHSERLANIQLLFVGVGVGGFTASFAADRLVLGAAFAGVMATGLVVFCYNLGRTLATARPWDVTERRFAAALGFFALAALLGASLALDFVVGAYPIGPVRRGKVVNAHLTLAIFGGVGSTVIGALYQLGPMFTQAPDARIHHLLERLEGPVYGPGVLILACGWLFESPFAVGIGGAGVGVGLAAVGVALLRQVIAATVRWTPMRTRYAVVCIGFVAWGITAAATWVRDPLAPGTRLGSPEVGGVLLFGAVAFVVLGTLYHIVPFIIWVHRYSGGLGFEPVPMIDDLYDGRLARLDLAATATALLLFLVAPIRGGHVPVAEPVVVRTAAVLAVIGVVLAVANLTYTIVVHAPSALGGSRSRGLSSDE